MPRRLVCEENGDPINGLVIAKGALTLPEGTVPVTWNFNDAKAIGFASNFQREDDGKISAEIELHHTLAQDMDRVGVYSIQATGVEHEPIDPTDPETLYFVIAGVIRSVGLTPGIQSAIIKKENK